MLCKESLAYKTVWLVMKRTISEKPAYYYSSLMSGPDCDEGSGRNTLDARGPEQMVEALDQRIDPLFRQRADHTGEGLKGVRASPVLRALRHLAGDHRGAHRPFRPMIG